MCRTNQKNISVTDPMKGPGRDHSNNTAAGHFLYVTVPETGLKMDWAAFQSKLLQPTNSSHPCKMVMYTHQFGPRSGGLTVLVADKNIYPVWERGGALGDLWVRAEVEIVTNTTFQILIMAAIRDFDYGGIGVDSIVLSPECRPSSENWTMAAFPDSPKDPCTSPDKMCDFHVNCDGANDENKCGQCRPNYEKFTAAGQQKTDAQTKTPLLGPSGPACTLSFDYALIGSPEHIGELSVRVMDSLLGPLPKVWEFGGKTGTEAGSWNHTDVHIGQRSARFQVDRRGLCGWYQDNSDNFDWTLLEGWTTPSSGSGLVEPSLRGAFGRMLSYTLPYATDMCLSFYYKLYGPNTGALNVKLLDGHGYELTLWSRTGAHGNMWHEAQCSVPPQLTSFRLAFEAVRSGFDGRVAIDDVALTDTPCTSLPRMCSFEGTRCDFSSTGQVRWRHGNSLNASGPKNDHTLETALGYYMMVNSGSDVLHSGAVSSLTSPVYYGTSRTECLQFWYHMGGESPGSLTVYMKPVKGQRVKIFSNNLNQGDVWRHGHGDISSGRLNWQSVMYHRHLCSKCTLEEGMCDWSNTQDLLKDLLDWELTSHWLTSSSENTPKLPRFMFSSGHFLFIPSSDRTAANQNAWLLSPHLPPTKGTCLKFWAYMPHSGDELMVLRLSEGDKTVLLSTNDTRGNWRRFDINITSTQEYQIVLEGVKGTTGFLALDDIEYTVGVDCTGKQTDSVKSMNWFICQIILFLRTFLIMYREIMDPVTDINLIFAIHKFSL
uniref:MAM domain-containing protein n=1 Tax=Neogobius melanostomus TaxID=47308 RepID=A0A8C6TLB0_9GOBI